MPPLRSRLVVTCVKDSMESSFILHETSRTSVELWRVDRRRIERSSVDCCFSEMRFSMGLIRSLLRLFRFSSRATSAAHSGTHPVLSPVVPQSHPGCPCCRISTRNRVFLRMDNWLCMESPQKSAAAVYATQDEVSLLFVILIDLVVVDDNDNIIV